MENNEAKDKNRNQANINENKTINEINQKFESIQLNDGNKQNDNVGEYIIKIIPLKDKNTQPSKFINSICKIKVETPTETIVGIGFLLKFCLLFNDHILKKYIINNNDIIHIYYNNDIFSQNSSFEDSKRYIKNFKNIGLDIIVVEILEKDNIPHDYFLRNEDEIENKRLINSNICIKQFNQDKLTDEIGNIIKINNKQFTYLSNLVNDSSGYPIFLGNSEFVLGIGKGCDKDKSEKYGDLIYPIINIIKNDITTKRNHGKYINGKYIWEDGKYYIGEYKDNIPFGNGKKYYSNGNILYEGNFINGKFEGNGKYYYDDGYYFIGEYKDGLRNGKGDIILLENIKMD